MTDAEASHLLSVPKRIGETLRWHDRRDDRPGGRELRATIIADVDHDLDRELTLIGESYQSRSGFIAWSLVIRVSNLRELLIRIDRHAKAHVNSDLTRVEGCMMHLWSEAHRDGYAVAADHLIDCTNVDAALLGFLRYCNIDLLSPYQLRWQGE